MFPCPPQEQHFPTDLWVVWHSDKASHLFSVTGIKSSLLSPNLSLLIGWRAGRAPDEEHKSRSERGCQTDVLWLFSRLQLDSTQTSRLIMSLYADLTFQDSVKEQLFRWGSIQIRKHAPVSFHFCHVVKKLHVSNCCNFVFADANSAWWRRNALMLWRSWRLWSWSMCRAGSQCQTWWRKQSPCSPWGKPCWHTTATPNTPETFYGCFLTQRKTWLHSAAEHQRERTLKIALSCMKLLQFERFGNNRCFCLCRRSVYWREMHFFCIESLQNFYKIYFQFDLKLSIKKKNYGLT